MVKVYQVRSKGSPFRQNSTPRLGQGLILKALVVMAIEVTLKLSESLVEEAQRLGYASQKDVATVLTEALEQLWPTLENLSDETLFPEMANLSDAEVSDLATAKMPLVQNDRLGELQSVGKTTGLTEAERYEIFALMQIYQLGQLRKSEAIAELARRGLQPPLGL